MKLINFYKTDKQEDEFAECFHTPFFGGPYIVFPSSLHVQIATQF